MDQPSGVVVLAVEWTLISLSLCCVLLRYCLRWNQRRRLSFGDYLAGAAWLFSVGVVICDTISYPLGVFTTTLDDVPVTVPILQLGVAADYFYYTGLFFSKGSLVAVLITAVPKKMHNMRLTLKLLAGYIVLCLFPAIFIYSFWCLPLSSNWTLDGDLCVTAWSYAVADLEFGFDISCSLLLFIVPLFFVFKVHVDTPRRIAISGIFLLGAIVITASVVNLIITLKTDLVTLPYILTTTETTCSTMIACLPTLNAFFPPPPASRNDSEAPGSSNKSIISAPKEDDSRTTGRGVLSAPLEMYVHENVVPSWDDD